MLGAPFNAGGISQARVRGGGDPDAHFAQAKATGGETAHGAVVWLGANNARLRLFAVVCPVASRIEVKLRNEGQDPAEAMRVVAPLVTAAGGTSGRVEQRPSSSPAFRRGPAVGEGWPQPVRLQAWVPSVRGLR